jgi:hypothetical protein
MPTWQELQQDCLSNPKILDVSQGLLKLSGRTIGHFLHCALISLGVLLITLSPIFPPSTLIFGELYF